MATEQSFRPVSRRAALAGLGAGGAALALASVRPVVAQDAAAEMADHPLVGTWLGQGSLSRLGADGLVTIIGAASFVNGAGDVVFRSPGLGVWEPVNGRSGRFTAVAVDSDAAGTVIGTVTLEGYLEASEDGQSWTDDLTHGTKITDRDANNNVIGEVTLDPSMPPATATRLKVWDTEFPIATPTAGTPTS